MITKSIFLTAALVLSSNLAFAHPGGHGDEAPPMEKPTKPVAIDEAKAKARALEEVERLVTAKKIDESWKKAGKLSEIKKKGEGDNWEWLITFDNAGVKEKDKKRLFVFLKQSGEFVAANFTGK